jgi:hypothetical protein
MRVNGGTAKNMALEVITTMKNTYLRVDGARIRKLKGL